MITLDEIKQIVFEGKKLKISKKEAARITESYSFLEQFSKDKVIYGINTGFGPMAQYRVSDADLNDLQYNIVRSHSCGVGDALPELYVRATMFARYLTFVQGKSGVHIDCAKQLQEYINRKIYPYIPEHGSVGASGDLVQLSQLALTLIGEGFVFYKGEKLPTAEVLKKEKLQPLQLRGRDGLSIVNGTACMTGIGVVNLIYSQKMLRWNLLFSSLMNEIASSYDDFLSPELNNIKMHPGQQKTAACMREILKDSTCLRDRQAELYEQKTTTMRFSEDVKVQPYYSLRCVPQILGPVLDELDNAEKVIVNEFNSVDDNPIVDVETKNVYHGGNFHGDYISFEMDKLKIAVTKMTMLMERQLNYLFHDRINGILPPFVNLGKLGLNYGLQALQFPATSTTGACQTLSNPMSIHSIPNNNDNQDIVSMGTNSALFAKRVIENSYQVAAIHCIALVQAVDCLVRDKRMTVQNLSTPTRALYEDIRKIVPAFVNDTPKFEELSTLIVYLKNANI
ncbi:MAG: aromatic amino acid ammonia-lyase [Bacteroidales bacterium]|nr:aromatic amino acid ammonia-lyase [Bacteroidales bacterium]